MSDAPPPAPSPSPAATITAATISAEVAGNRLDLITSGTERLAAIVALIDGAKESLRLLYYMFSEDEAGGAVRDALARAAGRGVDLKLLVDGFGCSDVKPDFLDPIKEAGGHYCIFHPRYGRRYLIRNHQKLAIADGSQALVGGSNINDHYMQDEGEERWRDLWLHVEGPAVTKLTAYFDDIEEWTTRKKARIRDLRRIIVGHSRDEGPVAWRFSGPMRRRNPWPQALTADLAEAKRLDIVTAYFSPPPAMLRRIGAVAARGEARIVNAAKSDNSATIAAARHTYFRLLRRRVQLYEYQPAKLHTKLYIVDDAVHIGSSNFDFRSLYLNLEMMLRVEDKGFADAMRGYVDGEIEASEAITMDSHRARSTWWRRLKWAMSHFLVTTMDYTVTRRINFGLE